MLKDRGENIPACDLIEVATKVKEKFGYCCPDVQKEFSKFDKKETSSTDELVQSARFKKLIHKTMNNNLVEIDVGYERFLAPEMFFHPEFVHNDWIKPIEEVLDDAI